jgi:hypothetical protein
MRTAFFTIKPSENHQQPGFTGTWEAAAPIGHPFGMVSVMGALEVGTETVGTTGAPTVEPTVLAKGDTPAVGMGAAELMPALLISEESSGIPVRETALPALDEVDKGVDDALTLLEPDPHIPDIPAVSMAAVGAESIDVDEIAGAVPSRAAVLPAIAPVAGAAAPAAIPPPSKVAADPNIPAGAVPTVEQTAPPFGMAIVPVEGPASGLTPEAGTSVAPIGMPVGETGDPAPPLSGDVPSSVGVGDGMAVICANATLPINKAGTTAAATDNLMGLLRDNDGMMVEFLSRSSAAAAPSDAAPANRNSRHRRCRNR